MLIPVMEAVLVPRASCNVFILSYLALWYCSGPAVHSQILPSIPGKTTGYDYDRIYRGAWLELQKQTLPDVKNRARMREIGGWLTCSSVIFCEIAQRYYNSHGSVNVRLDRDSWADR